MSIISLGVNGLNSPIKRLTVTEKIKKKKKTQVCALRDLLQF